MPSEAAAAVVNNFVVVIIIAAGAELTRTSLKSLFLVN